MKTVFTSILTLCSLPLLAQVTIDQSNYPATASYTDVFLSGAVAGVSAPSVGANQTWDYTGLVESSTISEVNYDAAGQTNFPDALRYFEDDLSFQGFNIPSNTYSAVDANGYYEYGRSISGATHSITAISGGANDVLEFPANDHVFQFENDRVDYVAFPATYQSSWTGTRVEPVDFNLTVAAFGLNNTPGQQVKYWTETREVVGYGSLTIPLPNGDPSAPMEVLLLESSVSVIDSFFVAGSQAPAPLLSAFGLTQGSTATGSSFLFYMPDFHSPVVRFGMDGSTVSSIGYRPVAASAVTGIAAAALKDVSIYPNPVNTATELNINFGEGGDLVSQVELVDVTGRIVGTQAIANALNSTRFVIPSNLVSGIYSVVLRGNDGAILYTSRVMVQ